MSIVFVIALIPMISGCASKLLQSQPETIVVTKTEQVNCDKEAIKPCDGIAIDSIVNAFNGVEAYIQAATALDACIDKHASLVSCIKRNNNAGQAKRNKQDD